MTANTADAFLSSKIVTAWGNYFLPCPIAVPGCRNNCLFFHRRTSAAVYGLTSCFRTGGRLIYGRTTIPVMPQCGNDLCFDITAGTADTLFRSVIDTIRLCSYLPCSKAVTFCRNGFCL